MSAVLPPHLPRLHRPRQPETWAFVQHYVATSGSRGQAAKLAGVTTTTARNLLKTSKRLRASATSTRSSSRASASPPRRSRRNSPTSRFQSANDLFDDDGNLIPINALPDHVASPIVQVGSRDPRQDRQDDEGNPRLRASPSRRSSAPTRWPG